MKILKAIILVFSLLTIVFTPIGLFTDLLFSKLVSAISLFCMSIFSIFRLSIENKNNKKK